MSSKNWAIVFAVLVGVYLVSTGQSETVWGLLFCLVFLGLAVSLANSGLNQVLGFLGLKKKKKKS